MGREPGYVKLSPPAQTTVSITAAVRTGLAKLVQHKHLLVYSLSGPAGKPSGRLHALHAVHVTWANPQVVRKLFTDDHREKLFLDFLAQGFTGLLMYAGDSWTGYAWMTTPSTPGPPHLPRCVRKIGANWIFYCRTRRGWRGQGLYTYALQLLVERVNQTGTDAPVMIDTSAHNIPSRRAILSIGFCADGTLEVYQLTLPGIGRWVWGSWRAHLAHPPLQEGASIEEREHK